MGKLLEGKLVSVIDYRCAAQPGDEAFVETHYLHSLSFVRCGCFGCKVGGHRFDLIPGSILIGYPGDDYMCTHDHVFGDQCLSFQFGPEIAECVKVNGKAWQSGAIPPVRELVVLAERALAATDSGDDLGLDEMGLMFAMRFAEINDQHSSTATKTLPRERRAILQAVLWMEENASEEISLEAASRRAEMNPIHFIRLFARVTGVTPHQYVIVSRLRQAARRLAQDDGRITEIAFASGFGDLSNFVRTFKRAAGVSPLAFRRLASMERKPFIDRLETTLAN